MAPVKCEPEINLKTAKTLGLKVPLTQRAQTDRLEEWVAEWPLWVIRYRIKMRPLFAFGVRTSAESGYHQQVAHVDEVRHLYRSGVSVPLGIAARLCNSRLRWQ